MLVRASCAQIANALGIIKRTTLHNPSTLLTGSSCSRWDRQWRHSRHLGKSHTLERHHSRHGIVLVKWRKRRRHDRKSTSRRRGELPSSNSAVSPTPISSTTSPAPTWGLERTIMVTILGILIGLETLLVSAFPIEIRIVQCASRLWSATHKRLPINTLHRPRRRIERKRRLLRNYRHSLRNLM